ncbi:hypothetical protein ABUT55_22865, partial [Escherichia coli]|uniref:hypothetical protein n=1 Tax=Escherichia coli TaxID=562 RepID=UPI00335461AE
GPVFHTIVSIKNDGHYFCRAGGNRPDGLNEPVTVITSLAGNKRILLGWSGTEQYYESNVNRNHRLCQGALIH